MSLARKHYQRATAAQAAGLAGPRSPQTGEQYELHAAALWEARRTLKNIKSLEAKVARKRELLPEFAAYVAGVLEGGQGAQDDVLMTVMLWRLDVGDLEGGIEVAEYALRHGLDTPDRFERDTASIVAEQTAEEALARLEATDAEALAKVAAELVMHLSRAEALTADADMHDQIRAKLHKALGYAHRESGSREDALEHLRRALQLNDRVGVKKDIEKLERELKQQPQNAAQGQPAQG
ncbi:phage terminase small subunit [Halomonas urumqiensis]|uniref:Terminase n=1 Tax=Halomonas urumqiensis TaxID=1684789 RepID=A0A2N7UDN1_9GAMM|nr:phage terminase small subunit [Halomonas urumqiensis]PMR78539.1 terminase [Halomonas urumqiensis]PTB03684.1 terminase [Halomonas urumqiensis]GHE20103.1 bacteriophage terminase endonuclease subunit [Halomonas urumqiensis]